MLDCIILGLDLLLNGKVGAQLLEDPDAKVGRRSGRRWSLYNEIAQELWLCQRGIVSEEDCLILVLERILWPNESTRGDASQLFNWAVSKSDEEWTSISGKIRSGDLPSVKRTSEQARVSALSLLEAIRFHSRNGRQREAVWPTAYSQGLFGQLDSSAAAD